MKKKIALLIGTTFIAVLGGTFASRARINHIIYTRDPIITTRCSVPVMGKALLVTAQGTFQATLDPALPCQTVISFAVDD